MARVFRLLVALFVLLPLGLAAGSAQAEKRIALVIGNSGYQAGPINTAANDAGLIAQTLQASGFDVVGARDLDQDSVRRAFHDFLAKASASGPDTLAFVYLSGYGLQLEGENYFVPIDAQIARDTDVASEAVRISDYTRPLAALGLKASIVVLDVARANPFARSGQPLAGGLALIEPEPGMLIAFNAAPGTVAPEGQGSYGPYAQALAEMMREGGLPLPDVFERTRLRVNERTQGAEVPWHASRIQTSVVFFERSPDAPPPAVSSEQTASIRARPIRDLDAQQAYFEALDRDTLQGYLDFLAAYPHDPMAKRVRAIVAARREAIVWHRTRLVDTPEAYWSYLRRYPRGPHAPDARRRLAFLAAAFEPPPSFALIDYDVPPPPPDEFVYVDRPVLVFSDPVFGFLPPPPLLVFFLPPPPPEFIALPPPPPPMAVFVLPIPVYVPVPIWTRPPPYVAPPPNNVIFANVHNKVVINNTTNVVTITNPAGQTTTLQPQPPPAPAGTAGQVGTSSPAAAIGPALPPSVAQKATTIQNQLSPAGRTGQPLKQPLEQPLPGTSGRPLPPIPSAPAPPQPRQPPGQPLGQPLPGAPKTGGPQTGQPTQQQGQQPLQQEIRRPPPATTRPTPPAATGRRPPPPPPTVTRPPPPPTVSRPSPPSPTRPQAPPTVSRPPPPPPAVTRPSPPPAVNRPPPPPAAVTRPSPPPTVSRPSPPPPTRPQPPPTGRPSPPPPAVARPSPPMTRPSPPPAQGKSDCGGPGKPPCRR